MFAFFIIQRHPPIKRRFPADVSYLVADEPVPDCYQLPLAVKTGRPVEGDEKFDYEKNIWVCNINYLIKRTF